MRVGGGNLKSIVVLVVAAICAYLMVWTDVLRGGVPLLDRADHTQSRAVRHDDAGGRRRARRRVRQQGGRARAATSLPAGSLAAAIAALRVRLADFRESFDNILGGVVVGLAVVAGWYLTAGAIGQAWKEFAEMAAAPPLARGGAVATRSSARWPTRLHYLLSPTNFSLINFGVMALAGVIVGSFLYAIVTRNFRFEWFADRGDFCQSRRRRRADGHRRRARDGLHRRPGDHRRLDARDRLDPHFRRDRRRARPRR